MNETAHEAAKQTALNICNRLVSYLSHPTDAREDTAKERFFIIESEELATHKRGAAQRRAVQNEVEYIISNLIKGIGLIEGKLPALSMELLEVLSLLPGAVTAYGHIVSLLNANAGRDYSSHHTDEALDMLNEMTIEHKALMVSRASMKKKAEDKVDISIMADKVANSSEVNAVAL